jgi:hypothetical protein
MEALSGAHAVPGVASSDSYGFGRRAVVKYLR